MTLDHPINRKLHRDRELFTGGVCRLARRAFPLVNKDWQKERYAERNQMAWATRPECGDVWKHLYR